MRLFKGEKEERLIPHQAGSAFAKAWQRQWPSDIEAGDLVAVDWPNQTGFVIEKVVGVERLITNEIIDATTIILAATPRDNIDYGAAIIAILRRIVVAQDLHLGDRILVNRHADLVRPARLAGKQSVNRGNC